MKSFEFLKIFKCCFQHFTYPLKQNKLKIAVRAMYENLKFNVELLTTSNITLDFISFLQIHSLSTDLWNKTQNINIWMKIRLRATLIAVRLFIIYRDSYRNSIKVKDTICEIFSRLILMNFLEQNWDKCRIDLIVACFQKNNNS